jgi:hypothetical protein
MNMLTRRSLFQRIAAVVAGTVLAKMPLAGFDVRDDLYLFWVRRKLDTMAQTIGLKIDWNQLRSFAHVEPKNWSLQKGDVLPLGADWFIKIV